MVVKIENLRIIIIQQTLDSSACQNVIAIQNIAKVTIKRTTNMRMTNAYIQTV